MSTESLSLEVTELLPTLYRRARNLVRSDEGAQDLVHDTYVHAMTTASKPHSHVLGWLYRLMFHVHANRWRRGAGKRGQYRFDNPFVPLSFEITAPGNVEDSWDVERVLQLIETLPAAHRRTLELAAHEADWNELQRELGDPPTRIAAAREALRRVA